MEQLSSTVFAGSAPEASEQRGTKRQRQPSIVEVSTDKKALDTAVAEFFYVTGTPLHLVRHAQQSSLSFICFRQAMTMQLFMQVWMVQKDVQGNQQ